MKDTVYEATEEQYGYTRSQCARCGYYEDTITSCKIRLDEKGNKVSVHEGVAVERFRKSAGLYQTWNKKIQM